MNKGMLPPGGLTAESHSNPTVSWILLFILDLYSTYKMDWPFVCMFQTECHCAVLKWNRWEILPFTYPLHLARSSLYHLTASRGHCSTACSSNLPPNLPLQPAVDTVNQSTDFLIKRLHPVVGPNGPDL